jgi:hypothetical protein
MENFSSDITAPFNHLTNVHLGQGSFLLWSCICLTLLELFDCYERFSAGGMAAVADLSAAARLHSRVIIAAGDIVS